MSQPFCEPKGHGGLTSKGIIPMESFKVVPSCSIIKGPLTSFHIDFVDLVLPCPSLYTRKQDCKQLIAFFRIEYFERFEIHQKNWPEKMGVIFVRL